MNDLITIDNEKAILRNDMITTVITIESQLKELKKVQDEYKKAILEAMEEAGVIKLVDEITGLSITRVEAKENQEKFHPELLREKEPDKYDEYVTFDGKKSAYLIIKN